MCIVTASMLLLAGFATARSTISGPQRGTLGPGEYFVDGDLSIVDGGTLTIKPGTTFLFNGPYNFEIGPDQTLVCVGSATDSIRFVPNVNSGVTQWGHVSFDASDKDDVFEYCVVTGGSAEYGGGLVIQNGSKPVVVHSRFSGNSATWGGGIAVLTLSQPMIQYCTVSYNKGESGIYSGSKTSPTIDHCTVTENSEKGIAFVGSANPTVEFCTVSNNALSGVTLSDCDNAIVRNSKISDNGDKGIECNSNATIEFCDVTDNAMGIYSSGDYSTTISNSTVSGHSTTYGAGITCGSGDQLVITHSTIVNNSASMDGGGIYFESGSHATISQCTIANNSARNNGGGVACDYRADPTIVNCSVTANVNGGVWVGVASNPAIKNSNFHKNTEYNYSPGLSYGNLEQTNINGDPCDYYGNIDMEPHYVDAANGNFNLLPTSPCIDAGDLDSQRDLDGTLADVGARYYPQEQAFSVYLVADDAISTTRGSSFTFRAAIASNHQELNFVDVWTEVIQPDGKPYSPIWWVDGYPMKSYSVTEVDPLGQNIPTSASIGTYTYIMNVGMYPDLVVATDSFMFEVVADVADPVFDASDWNGFGYQSAFESPELTMEGETVVTSPSQYAVLTAYPNPFNPTTTISVALPNAAELSVTVYNALGQQVAELANGSFNVGTHNFTLDGSSLASGIYFVHATVPGQLNNMQKIVLMK